MLRKNYLELPKGEEGLIFCCNVLLDLNLLYSFNLKAHDRNDCWLASSCRINGCPDAYRM